MILTYDSIQRVRVEVMIELERFKFNNFIIIFVLSLIWLASLLHILYIDILKGYIIGMVIKILNLICFGCLYLFLHLQSLRKQIDIFKIQNIQSIILRFNIYVHFLHWSKQNEELQDNKILCFLAPRVLNNMLVVCNWM